jgi:uncharacterized protein (DUF58 family)
MNYRSGDLSKLDVACMLAAALAYLLVRQQDAVGLVVLKASGATYVPPRSSAGHLQAILQALEGLRGEGPTRLSDAADLLSEKAQRRSAVVLLSDLFDEDPGALSRLLQLRLRKNDVSIFHVLDPAELEFPFEDNTLFLSMEDERSQQANPREIRESYLEELQGFLDGARRRCFELDCDYEPVRTDEPMDRALLRYLGAARPGGGRRHEPRVRQPVDALGRLARGGPPAGPPLQPQARPAAPLRGHRLRAALAPAHPRAGCGSSGSSSSWCAPFLLALPVALARPQARKEEAAASPQGPAATAIVLDTSLSMAYGLDGKPLLERAREMAKDALASLAAEDPVTLVPASRTRRPRGRRARAGERARRAGARGADAPAAGRHRLPGPRGAGAGRVHAARQADRPGDRLDRGRLPARRARPHHPHAAGRGAPRGGAARRRRRRPRAAQRGGGRAQGRGRARGGARAFQLTATVANHSRRR